MKIYFFILSIIFNEVIEVKEMRIQVPIRTEHKLSGWSILSDFDTDTRFVKFNYRQTGFISVLHNTLMLYSNYVQYDIDFGIDYEKYYYSKKEDWEEKKDDSEEKKDDSKENNSGAYSNETIERLNKKRDLIFIFNLDNELREISHAYTEYKTELSGIAIVGILNLEKEKLEISLHYNLESYEFNFKEDISLFLDKTDNIHELDFPLDYKFKLKIDYLNNLFILENNDVEILRFDNLNSYIYNSKSSFHLYSISKKIVNSFLLKDLKVYKDTIIDDKEYSDEEYNKLMKNFNNHFKIKKVYEPIDFIDLIKNQNNIEHLTSKIYKNLMDIESHSSNLRYSINEKRSIITKDIINNKVYKKKLEVITESFNNIIDTQENIKSGFNSLDSTILSLEKINELRIEDLDQILKDLDVIINLNEMKDIVENINTIDEFMRSSDFNVLKNKLKDYMVKDNENNISYTLLFFGFLVLGLILGLLITVGLKINKAQKSHIL